jgi:RNA polymerase sigma factor (sigma-70 family)
MVGTSDLVSRPHAAGSGFSNADQEALFNEAYSRIRRAVRSRAHAAVVATARSHWDLSDLEQEAMVAAWRALVNFDESKGSLRTFLEHVTIRRIASIMKSRRATKRIQSIGHRVTDRCSHPADRIDLHVDIARVLKRLEQNERVVAQYLIDNTPSQVSRHLGIARSTVYARISRIRLALADAGLKPSATREPRSKAPTKMGRSTNE